MKIQTKITLLLSLFFIFNTASSQDKDAANALVDEGVELHDKGEFEKAIAKYDEALLKDENNVLALGEKAYSLLSLNRLESAISVCQLAIKTHPNDSLLKTVYVTYANAVDGTKDAKRAIEIYDEGLKKFPDFYQLYFNKAITLVNLKDISGALKSAERAVSKNPDHASSHNLIARVNDIDNQRIPALMAVSRFFVIEPQSKRAKSNIEILDKLLTSGVEKTGKKSVTINISEASLKNSNSDEVTGNSFGHVEMILQMTSAMDYDKKYKKFNKAEHYHRKLESVCTVMNEIKDKNSGFYWEYYAPYFIELKNSGHLETFCYIAYAMADDENISKWLEEHEKEIDAFYDWENKYTWR